MRSNMLYHIGIILQDQNVHSCMQYWDKQTIVQTIWSCCHKWRSFVYMSSLYKLKILHQVPWNSSKFELVAIINTFYCLHEHQLPYPKVPVTSNHSMTSHLWSGIALKCRWQLPPPLPWHHWFSTRLLQQQVQQWVSSPEVYIYMSLIRLSLSLSLP